MLSCEPGNAQAIGDRTEQQDAFAFSDPADESFTAHGGVLAVLADGMGGMEGGREAAAAAVEAFVAAYQAKSPDETVPDAMARSLAAANHAVTALPFAPGTEGAGTTLVAVVVLGASCHWISVGDSRAYLVRGERARQMSADHVYGARLDRRAARGEISVAAAREDPQREALTSYVGLPSLSEIDRSPTPAALEPHDVVLLCSDGLYKGLTEDEIVAARAAGSAQSMCDLLVAAVLGKARAHQDNVTVVALALNGVPVSNPG